MTESTYWPHCTCDEMTGGGPCPWCERRRALGFTPTPSNAIEVTLRLARELHPDLWARTEGVARIIAPEAFVDDWLIFPREQRTTHAAKLALMRSNAMRKAQDVLAYLGVNTATDWGELLERLAKEGR